MMAVELKTEQTLSVGRPRLLFEGRYETGPAIPGETLDGQRFLMLKVGRQEQAATKINVVLNWFDELKRRVPLR